MFEHIFVIHLTCNHQLWNQQFNKLQEYLRSHSVTKEIQLHIIEAVDGKYFLDKEPLFMNQLIKSNIISMDGRGFRKTLQGVINEFCCYLSHIKAWNNIVSESYNNVLILEEGVLFESARWDEFIEYYELSPDKFKQLMACDISFFNKNFQTQQRGDTHSLEGFSLQAYSVRKEAVSKLISHCKGLTCPIDLYIRNICNESKLTWMTYTALYPYTYLFDNNYDRHSNISGGYEKLKNQLNSHQEPLSFKERIINKLFQEKTPFQYLL